MDVFRLAQCGEIICKVPAGTSKAIEPLAEPALAEGVFVDIMFVARDSTHERCHKGLVPSIVIVGGLFQLQQDELNVGGCRFKDRHRNFPIFSIGLTGLPDP